MNSNVINDWWLLDSGECDYAFNMALDECLLECATAVARPVLRFYGWRQSAASFGYSQRIIDIEVATHLRPLVRRPTGGGLVPHDNDWTYSVTIPPSHPWYGLSARESYERMHRWIQDAFRQLSVPTELAPCSRKEIAGQCFAGHEQHDLLWRGRKIAGAAQRRTLSGLLIQGSVQPPARVERQGWHDAMVEIVRLQWRTVVASWTPPAQMMERAKDLATEKYSRDCHNRKR